MTNQLSKIHIFQKGSTTFFYSSLFFPEKVRGDVFALYAYVRIVDDAVDQVPADEELFEKLWNETTMAWKGKHTSHPIVRDFIELARRKQFKWEWIKAFWWAMRQDLTKKKYATFTQLEKYMYGSAEVIGLMMARILDLPKEADEAAQLQGKAMQLINFIRDVQEDDELGRQYLVRKDDWRAVATQGIQQYFAIQKQAKNGYQFIPRRYLIPIKTAADMYSWTANQILSNPDEVWRRKIKPAKLRVLFAAARNMMSI